MKETKVISFKKKSPFGFCISYRGLCETQSRNYNDINVNSVDSQGTTGGYFESFITSCRRFLSGLVRKDMLVVVRWGLTGLPPVGPPAPASPPGSVQSSCYSAYSVCIWYGHRLFAWTFSWRWENYRHSLPISIPGAH